MEQPFGKDEKISTPSGVATGFSSRFRAHRTAPNQIIPINVNTKLRFQTEDFDGLGEYDNAVNFWFAPTVAGYYEISATARLIYGGANINVQLWLIHNGAPVSDDYDADINIPAGTGEANLHIRTIVYAVVGDKFWIEAKGTAQLTFVATSNQAHFEAHRLS